MIYPAFLEKKDTIGICAPSSGVGDDLESFDASLETLKQRYQIKETSHVRVASNRGGDALSRGKEFNELVADPQVKMIMAAAGGDFLNEMIPYIDFDNVKKHPKWILGASDPTGILFPVTTICDVATLYGCNAGSFDADHMNDMKKNTLKIIGGDIPVQYNSELHSEIADFLPDYDGLHTPTLWQGSKKEFKVTGRCIGGCIDVLKDLIGTRFDHVSEFNERYQKDGIIWYFDNFSLSAEVFYRTLCQFKYAGWFKYTKAVIVGRVLFKSSETGMTYAEALGEALSDIPYVYEADIGHTNPAMTMINGALMNLNYKEGTGHISFTLK